MKIELTKFINTLTISLDYVEEEIIKTARNHGKRIAVLTNLMARKIGIDDSIIFVLTEAALLHDCALSEYFNDELDGNNKQLDESNMSEHCITGEEMLMKIPGYEQIKGAVLYHHERADGNGALGKKSFETPLAAQLIHLADILDVTFSLDTMDINKYRNILIWLDNEADKAVSKESIDVFKQAIDYETLCSIAGEGCRTIVKQMLPDFTDEISTDILREMASFFAKIVDYKSHFTWRHSIGIAEKAEKMGQYYNYSKEICDKLYIAGALHDIGKLLISNDILEKPDKLSSTEYKKIQNHAMGTWTMLSPIGGLEDISRWASLHHEKLDGSGYPFGYKAEDLGKNERLIACLDIYQALVEKRPYKAGMTHNEAISVLNKMAASNQLDSDIIHDIDLCFSKNKQAEEEQYIAETKQAHASNSWRCPVCGYIYEGDLSADFICPRCEQPASVFENIINTR